MTRLLLLIDIQRDYFPGGRRPLVGADAAADAAAGLLAGFRTTGQRVVHVQHVSDDADASFLAPGSPGAQFDARVAPDGEEHVVVKHEPNAFLGTGLEALLRAAAPDEIVVAGMMSSMCVDATVRAASDLGFPLAVAEDACAAPDLTLGDRTVPGAQVHAAFMAALDGTYARVSTAQALAGELASR
ncbi:cysteine hydrolase family protein [Microbacterium atlanticum]|uniref:cysteine hydrolase family protein n=1 Tax=Microbacterium atlanticum TaxID=2782168 RepID=UPI00188916C9|nr:cysteine hydrolase family protein [Microbacterium atlanticum]